MSIQQAYFKSVPLFYMFTQYLTTDRSIQVEGIKIKLYIYIYNIIQSISQQAESQSVKDIQTIQML